MDIFCDEAGLLFISLGNIGARPARDVRVAFDRPMLGLGGRQDVTRLRMFQRTSFLAPGRTIRSLVDSVAAYLARGEPPTIRANISFADDRGRRHRARIEHDLGIFGDLAFVNRTP